MKLYILTFLILLFSYSVTSGQRNNDLRKEIEKLDLAHAEAIFKGDAKALDKLMDDEVTVNHPTNKIVNEKAELLRLIKSGVIRYTSFKRYPEKFLFFTDMVIVMGSEEVTPAKGAPNAGKKLKRRYTNVWMKKKNTWKLTVRHANNVCAE
ncbi:nuclear transport factor 2 family protein [Rufibacter soli]